MPLSKDPSRREVQLANLAKGRQALAERLASGEPRTPPSKRKKPPVVSFKEDKTDAAKPAAKPPRKQPSAAPRARSGERPAKRGLLAGFIDGFLGRY